MSYDIARNIKTLRIEREMSQEEVAHKLNMSRQRYSRIESNQVQITFGVIETLASIFGVGIKDITKASNEKKTLEVLFRESGNHETSGDVIEKVQRILDYMSAHEKLYYKMRERGNHEKL